MLQLFSKIIWPLALSLQASAWAQNVQDAGRVRQQIEQPQVLPLAVTKSLAPKPVPSPPLSATSNFRVQVTSLQFSGNTLLSSEQLRAALIVFVGSDLDFAGLQRATSAAAAAYRNAGWLAHVFLPEQDISTGVVTLHIVESRFAGLNFEGETSKRIMRSEIETYFLTQQRTGQFLNAAAMDRALLLTDDLPGVSVAGTLAPGMDRSETTLVLQTTDEPFIYGDAGLDNTGARATGTNRWTANMNINSPGGRGELFSINLLHTQGSDYGRVALTVPDHHNGLRLGANASSMTYKVIDGPGSNSNTSIQGRSGSTGLDWSYPLVRERLHNLYFSGGLDNKRFFNRDTQVRSDYESNGLRMGLSGNHFDELGGGGANSVSVQGLWGRLSSMQAHTLLDTIGRDYHKVNYSVSRQQTLTDSQSLLVNFHGQQATQVLDSSEKFYIGGSQTVRAYPVGELGGERGQVISTEWRWRLDPNWVLSAFADLGRVVSLPATSSEQNSTLWLRGQGMSLGWQGSMGLMAKLTWAHRSGQNPKPTFSGTDGDGTLNRNRFWFTANVPL